MTTRLALLRRVGPAEDVVLGEAADGRDDRMRELAFRGDGIDLLPDGLDAANNLDLVLPNNNRLDRARGGEISRAGLAERHHQSGIVEFADDAWMQPLGLEPAHQARMQRDLDAGQQEGRALQNGRKIRDGPAGQRWRAEDAHGALAEKMIVAAHVEVVRHRPIGDHHVEAMDGQIAQQGREPALATNQPDRFIEAERRLDQSIRHHLRYRIGDADAEDHALGVRVGTDGFEQLVAEGEDLLGIAEHALAGFGQFETASDPPEQVDAQRRLEFAELAADRLRRQVEPLAGARDAAGLGHHPEIAQVLEIKAGHRKIFVEFD